MNWTNVSIERDVNLGIMTVRLINRKVSRTREDYSCSKLVWELDSKGNKVGFQLIEGSHCLLWSATNDLIESDRRNRRL